MSMLHEKKISEVFEGWKNPISRNYIISKNKQWAIAVVKDYLYKMPKDLEIIIDPRKDETYRTSFRLEKSRKQYPNEPYIQSVMTFLIDRFEITEEDLK